MRSLSITSQPGGARALLDSPHLDGVALAWLGQAGFALRYGKLRILLDPYLSDYLERKYRGTNKPHERLMKVPIHTQEFEELDWVPCTHQHSDHMDPDALPILASKSPSCRFIVPTSESGASADPGYLGEANRRYRRWGEDLALLRVLD